MKRRKDVQSVPMGRRGQGDMFQNVFDGKSPSGPKVVVDFPRQLCFQPRFPIENELRFIRGNLEKSLLGAKSPREINHNLGRRGTFSFK